MADITPIPAPYLDLPASSKTVRVRAIDTTTRMVCDARAFVQPPIAGHEKLNFKTMCFLLEHTAASGSEHVLFDCGSRKDFWNGSPQTKRMIGGHVPAVQIDKGVDEILTSAGLHLEDLKAIVWSHWHWDHIGDGSKFPSATDIVVGPGFTAEFVPGWPERLESFVLASDLAGHRVHEPEFDMTVAGFPAHDYFGNGSFYLLEVPGVSVSNLLITIPNPLTAQQHALGHICGFARTTPDTFVFMGGDCCHYAGAFRPTPYLPLPLHIPTDELDAYYPRPCPCSMFTVHHPTPKKDGNNALNQSRTKPFYDISQAPGSAYSFGDVAQSSVNMLQALDAHPGIFICLSHDDVLFNILPLLNEEPTRDINDWQSLGYKERSRWAFLNELPKGDNPGREPLVTGLWRDGRQVTWRADSGFVDVEK